MIGRRRNAADAGFAVQGRHGRQSNDRRTVGVRDEFGARERVVGVHFRDDERHRRIQAKGARIIDDRDARSGRSRQVNLRNFVVGGAQKKIEPSECVLRSLLNREHFTAEFDLPAGAAATAEKPKFFNGELTFGKHDAHLFADGTRRAQNTDLEFLGLSHSDSPFVLLRKGVVKGTDSLVEVGFGNADDDVDFA